MRRALLITLLTLGVAAGPAHAGWSPPRAVNAAQAAGLEPTGTPGGYWLLTLGQGIADVFSLTPHHAPEGVPVLPHPTGTALLAGDGRGRIVAVGEDEPGTVRVHRRTRDGEVTTDVVPLPLAQAAAVGSGMDAAVSDVGAVAFAPDGDPWGVPVAGDGRAFYVSDVAVAADGTVDFAYATDRQVRLLERRPSGKTMDTRLADYEVARKDAVPAIRIATGPERALAVIWTQPAGPVSPHVRATLVGRTRTDDGHFGSLQTIDTSRNADLSPQVAITPDGRAIATWVASHVGSATSPRGVRSAFSAPGPGWFGPPIPVPSFGRVEGGGPPERSGRDAHDLDLALGRRGSALLAWASSCGGCDTKIAVSATTPTGRFHEPRILSRLGTISERPFVSADGHGGGALAWTQRRLVTGADPVTMIATAGELPSVLSLHDQKPPRGDLTARRIGHTVRVRVRCGEACVAHINAHGAIGTTHNTGVVRIALRPGPRPHSAAFTLTDRAGNITYGRVKIRA
jgi:hypothetical protein